LSRIGSPLTSWVSVTRSTASSVRVRAPGGTRSLGQSRILTWPAVRVAKRGAPAAAAATATVSGRGGPGRRRPLTPTAAEPPNTRARITTSRVRRRKTHLPARGPDWRLAGTVRQASRTSAHPGNDEEADKAQGDHGGKGNDPAAVPRPVQRHLHPVLGGEVP